MGQRFYDALFEKYPYLKFTKVWCSPGVAKYMKRRLSKVRRRAWRDPHKRGIASVESECNWRGW